MEKAAENICTILSNQSDMIFPEEEIISALWKLGVTDEILIKRTLTMMTTVELDRTDTWTIMDGSGCKKNLETRFFKMKNSKPIITTAQKPHVIDKVQIQLDSYFG